MSEFLGTKRHIQKAKICGRIILRLTVREEETLFFVGNRGDVHTDSYVQPPSVSSILLHTLPSTASP